VHGHIMAKRTTIEWLHCKGLVTDTELLAGEVLGLLLEWRLTLIGPVDSTVLFAEHYTRTAPLLQLIPVQFHLRDIERDGEMQLADLEKLGASACAEETAGERQWRKLASWSEWMRLQRLFREALPEHSGLLADLGRAATERIPVRMLPYQQVPLICSALYLLKEYWREVLLTEAIDVATGIIDKAA
jgi:hypothetical protein